MFVMMASNEASLKMFPEKNMHVESTLAELNHQAKNGVEVKVVKRKSSLRRLSIQTEGSRISRRQSTSFSQFRSRLFHILTSNSRLLKSKIFKKSDTSIVRKKIHD